MNDYGEISDREINQAVTCEVYGCHGWEINNEGTFYHCGIDGSGYHIQTVPDYCNNPQDAWSIVDENKISVSFDDSMPSAYKEVWLDDISGAISYFEFESCDPKRLRAAMIVYLMIKDEE